MPFDILTVKKHVGALFGAVAAISVVIGIVSSRLNIAADQTVRISVEADSAIDPNDSLSTTFTLHNGKRPRDIRCDRYLSLH